MSKRTRKLAEQAKCYADENSAHYLQNPHWIETFEEKFAELIVKECAKSANEWYQNHNQIHWDPATHVLAHFGVEE